jgi:hypothetical protein
MIIIISFLNALISAASGEYDAELTRYAMQKIGEVRSGGGGGGVIFT